jgi:hypothetical protein
MYWSGILTTNLPDAPGTTDYILLHRGPRHLTRPRLPGLAVRPRLRVHLLGHAGLGFAVVADEVRNLSQRVAGATQETGLLGAGIHRQFQKRSVRVAAGDGIVP